MLRPSIRLAVLVPLLAGLAPAQTYHPPKDEQPGRPAISLKVPLDGSSSRELRLYPVHAYIDAILDAQEGIEVLSPEDRVAGSRPLLRRLRDAIGTFVLPAFVDGEEVQALGHEHLAVVGRDEQHAWVERFLALQQERANTIAIVDFEILQMPPRAFQALKIGDEPRVLDAEAAAAFRQRLLRPDDEAAEGVDRLEAPRLSLLALQRAQVSALEQTAYVKDIAVVTLDGGKMIADPVVDVIQAGISLDGSFVLVDREVVGLSWTVKISDLQRPIPEFERTLPGTTAPVTIQVPNVATAEFEAQVVLPPGALSVFPGPELRGKRVVLLMNVSKLETAREPAPRRGGPTLELTAPGARKR